MENENIKKVMRIIEVVNKSGGNMSEFARKIDVTPSYISKLSTQPEKCRPSSLVLNSICHAFNVNREWLETGEGEMFIKKDPQPLDKLLSELLDGQTVTDEDRTLVKNFLELPDASRKAVIEFVQRCAGELSAPVVDAKSEATTQADPDLAAKVAALERQNEEMQRQNQEKDKQLQALSARLAVIEEEDALGFLPDTGNLA